MEHAELLAHIKQHLARTGERPYHWSKRVMGDKTYLWKVENRGRMPYPRTVKKILTAINRKEATMKAHAAKKRKRGR